MLVHTKSGISRSIAIAVVIAAGVMSYAAQNTSQSPTPTPAASASIGYTVPSSKTRFNRYVNGMFGPTALAKTVVSAGYFTWRNSPSEWGPSWRGFGKRVGSGIAKGVIKGTVSYGLDESFKLDSHYYSEKNGSVSAKIKNAVLGPVTARTRSGKRVFGFPNVVGTYTSSVAAAEWWFPARYTWKDGLRSGTISLGMSAAFNLVKEFIHK